MATSIPTSPELIAHGVAHSPEPIYRYRKACLSKQLPLRAAGDPHLARGRSRVQARIPVGSLQAIFSPPSLSSSLRRFYFAPFPNKLNITFGCRYFARGIVTGWWCTGMLKGFKGAFLVYLECIFRWSLRAQHLWQYSHWCGFSLVWVLIWDENSWRLRWLLRAKVFVQYAHSYSFSLVWIPTCVLRSPFSANISGNAHTDMVSLWCGFLCVV